MYTFFMDALFNYKIIELLKHKIITKNTLKFYKIENLTLKKVAKF